MKHLSISTFLSVSLLSITSHAGTEKSSKSDSEPNIGDFCQSLETIGELYKNDKNPFIQEVSLSGRFQGQYAYVDGSDVNGKDFNYQFEEVRRLRADVGIDFLKNFQLKASIDLVDDQKPQGLKRDWGYQGFNRITLSYEIKDVLGLDELKFAYGRDSIDIGQEGHSSSRNIKTVERSAIIDKIYDGRYTGLAVTGQRGDVDGTLGIYSLDLNNFISNWNAGKALYASTDFPALDGDVTLDFVYNLDQGTPDDQVGMDYRWAASAAWDGKIKGWDLMVNAIAGDNGVQAKADREGTFYGFIIMPSKDIIKDKLEFVTRYQYQAATHDDGIRVNSRYLRNSEQGATDLDGGRGKAHQSIYTGLNYFFCGHRSKLMTGVEYETLDTLKEDVKSTTFWLAYRTYF